MDNSALFRGGRCEPGESRLGALSRNGALGQGAAGY
jgi:hypothetical protein